jgi:hypothetical protein
MNFLKTKLHFLLKLIFNIREDFQIVGDDSETGDNVVNN